MSTQQPIQVDIAIVGAGMVGATLAHLLARLPLKIALIDQREFTPVSTPFDQSELAFDPRVSALTEASKRLFMELGIWEVVAAKRVSPYQDMHVWDADGTGFIEFSAKEIGNAELGHIVENSLVLAALQESLTTLSNVRCIGGAAIEQLHTAVSPDCPDEPSRLVTKAGESIEASLIVAADGGNSLIRKLAHFEMSEWSYDHTAIVTTVKTERPHQARALQRFMSTGPLAFLPLATASESNNQHYCSIVWSCVPDLADSLMAQNEEEFNRSLELAIESKLGTIEASAKRFAVPLSQKHGKKYVQDAIVLVGDAAHTIHPLAGQGVNLGLLDVAALADELTQAVSKGRNPADPVVLKRYERRRKGHNLGTMWAMEGFKHLFAEEALPVRWLRNVGLRGVNNVPLLKNQIARKAMGMEG